LQQVVLQVSTSIERTYSALSLLKYISRYVFGTAYIQHCKIGQVANRIRYRSGQLVAVQLPVHVVDGIVQLVRSNTCAIECGFATYKTVRLDKLPIESGIDPVRLLLYSSLYMLLVLQVVFSIMCW
jgi:hypothetical protein